MKLMKKIGLTAILATAMSTAMAADHVRYSFATDASSAQAGVSNDTGLVTPVVSNATGSATLEFANDLSSATYKVRTANTGTIGRAHFHCAPAGVNGPPAVLISATQINAGYITITNADILPILGNEACGVRINNIASLLNATLKGHIYLNVHTDVAASGELRGQFFAPIED